MSCNPGYRVLLDELGDDSAILINDRSENQRYDGHQFDQDVHCRGSGIFERITYGIANDCRFVGKAAFAAMFILVLAANLFADAVRDAFDPRAA